jgi:primosomal protein N' (replication factor Y)
VSAQVPPRAVAVAVPVPFLDSLTYAVPDGTPMPAVGARVEVPVGTRTLTGCVVEVNAGVPAGGELREVSAVLDSGSLVPPAVVALCRWVADYYQAGVGDAVAMALPPGTARARGFRTERLAVLSAQGAAGPPPGIGPRQRAAFDVLAAAPDGLPVRVLRDRGIDGGSLARLAARGLVTFRAVTRERDPFDRAVFDTILPDPDRAPTAEQAAALETLVPMVDARRFGVALLHGVTGSGKSEVYLRLAQRAQAAGRRVLVLVPEIALTPSVAALFRGSFGARVAIQHSGLSAGERHDQWQRIRQGQVDVVVGTRSAVFAPLADVGLVVVDEEHDASYKQEETPRYHGRDVAIMRASREGALVVLGSATPSLESYQHATAGKYVRVTLGRRVLDRPLADVRVVNMRDEYAEAGPEVVLSRALAEAIERRLLQREQVLLLLNRRGYATAVFCRQCGDAVECPNCSVSLTVHTARRGWRARCHYCNYQTSVPEACRTCAAPYMEHRGFGTEQVEQHLRERFPEARVARVDRDAVRRQGALADILGRFASGKLDVLVGTQMIAKGHDFPRVTLVGVISADVGLGLADFRASERTFQLLTQVAGRAGRGATPGEAVVQTIFPEHYSVELACAQDYAAFFAREIDFRRSMMWPPLVALVNVVVRGRTFEDAMATACDLADALAARAAGYGVLGPAPAPLGRLRGEHRAQFFLKGGRRAAMHEALRAVLAERPRIRRHVTVDVDPLNVL